MSTVMIDVPATVVVYPIEGDVESALALGKRISATAGRYEEFDDMARVSAKVTSWWGIAADGYGRAAKDAADDHAKAAISLQRVARACVGYGDTLADLLVRRRGLVDDKEGLDIRRRDLLAAIAAAKDADDALIAELRMRASSLSDDYRGLDADVGDLVRRVQANEDLLRSAFGRTDTLAEARTGAIDPRVEAALGASGAPGSGATPEQVRAWWDRLDAATKEAVIAADPSLIGAADGLPAKARDQANRIGLEVDLARLKAKEADGTLTSGEEDALANARAAETALKKADDYVDPVSGTKPGGQLWLYDPTAFDGDGRTAIAVGDLDTADDVAVRVPGITNDGTTVPKLTEETISTYQAARYTGDGSTVASMVWLGYDAPSAFYDPATVTEDRAEDGGERFSQALDGLRASRPGDEAHLTAIGHSYGSTTVAHAASDHDIPADDIVLVGSPGAGGDVDEASDLNVGSDHVFVGRNSEDLVADLADNGWVGGGTLFGAGLGNDPAEDDFGATRFRAEDVDRNGWVSTTGQHGNYFRPDSESLYNIGRIVDGQGDRVNTAEHTYDPLLDAPQDPDADREPTRGVEGSSRTVPPR